MRILVVINQESAAAVNASMLLSAYFLSQNIDCDLVSSYDIPSPAQLASQGEQALLAVGVHHFDLVVALGGDGTILRASRVAALYDAPVMGINYGHLGFLANPSEPGVVPMVAAALSGDVTEDCRTNLDVEIQCVGDELLAPAERGARHFFALNEATISRGSCPRNLCACLEISGGRVCELRGDGLIVSSPTGSTAYALSAGGPLVSPGMRGLVVVPLASHTLQSRAIVTEGHDVVEVSFNVAEGMTFADVQLDGESLTFDQPIERMIVRCGEVPTKLLFYKKELFYQRVSRVFF